MKVGDYVRLDRCQGINKIEDFDEDRNKYILEDVIGDEWGEETFLLDENDVINYSSNIIDLIEEGDFIKIEFFSNRYSKRLERIFEVDYVINKSICFENGHCQLNILDGKWSNQDEELNPIIKTIVTKEQFKSMEYKV